jgi:nucleoside permease NupC
VTRYAGREMTAPQSRPRVVTAAFWCWLVAAILLIVGGLLAASVALPAVFRGVGVVTALAGAGMAFLAGRSRNGDTRFRRAAVALALTIVVLVALLAVFGVVHVLTLLAVLPLIAGTVLITRPAAASADEEPQ